MYLKELLAPTNSNGLPALFVAAGRQFLFRRMVLSVISGGTATKLAEGTIKGGDAFEPGGESNLRNIHIRISQKKLGTFHTLECKIFGKIITGSRLK